MSTISPPSSVAESTCAAPSQGAAKYEKVRDINSGSFGFVVQARHRDTGKHYAIKYIPCGATNKYVAREIINHSIMLHPHIVAFKEVFLTQDHLAIVMEYVNGGDMFNYVKRRGGLEEDEARWYFQQLVMAVAYCHAMGVVNRDIKLENTLLEDLKRPILKLCDFGYSKHDLDSRPKTWVGTPGYTAPEVMFSRKHYDGKCADVWSSGVMLYVMLFCEYPFGLPGRKSACEEGPLPADFLARMQDPDSIIPRGPQGEDLISPEARDLLLRMLCPDPRRRITVPQICQHPWFCQHLPAEALHTNDDCLRLSRLQRGPGHQSQAEIQALLAQAMVARHGEDASLGDDIIRRPHPGPGGPGDDEVLYQDSDSLVF